MVIVIILISIEITIISQNYSLSLVTCKYKGTFTFVLCYSANVQIEIKLVFLKPYSSKFLVKKKTKKTIKLHQQGTPLLSLLYCLSCLLIKVYLQRNKVFI